MRMLEKQKWGGTMVGVARKRARHLAATESLLSLSLARERGVLRGSVSGEGREML
jgi:hypothetical protein